MPDSNLRIRTNLDNLLLNAALLMSKGVQIMPVLKADAYGHGLLNVAKILQPLDGIKIVAVGTVDEAVKLRRGGFGGGIMALLGITSDDELAAVRPYDIIPLIHNWSGLTRLTEALAAMASSGLTPIAVKCDTGMARLGFALDDLPALSDFLAAVPDLRPEYLLSHLAVADIPEQDEYTSLQAGRFQQAARIMHGKFPWLITSLGNSACVLSCPKLSGDMGRPGLALYGCNPFFGTSREELGAGLRQVMQASAPILEVRQIQAGEPLGYGCAYIDPSPRKVAVVSVGYADGYRRGLSQQARMAVHGAGAPVIGRISMQMTFIDVTEISGVKPGDEAYLLGGEGLAAVSAHELAAWWNTIPYEVTCLLGKNKCDQAGE